MNPKIFLMQLLGEKSSKSDGFHLKIEEAHLVREQLKWLLAMSEKMPKILKETQF